MSVRPGSGHPTASTLLVLPPDRTNMTEQADDPVTWAALFERGDATGVTQEDVQAALAAVRGADD